MLDLSRLNAEQRRVVLAPDGPLLVVAGPGSGKTTVLAARAAYLVTARGVGPASVLALTFTTAAARELRARLGRVLGPAGEAIGVATFHSHGLRIVREWRAELGYDAERLAVYGDEDAREALREAAGEAGVDPARWPLRDLGGAVERLRLRGEPDAAPEEVRRAAAAYEALLRRRGAVDYAGMLALPLRLFEEHPRLLRLHQDAHRHVLADEFQDACGAQYRMLRLLAARHRNLVLVADPLQTLYQWRGADPRLVERFRADFPEAGVLSLSQNFRSTGRIVALANHLGAPLDRARRLWTDGPPGEPTVVHTAADERAEAAFVAAEVARLRDAGAVDALGDVAVLYRTNRQAEEVAVALRARGLPYRVRGGGDFFARREVRDALAYLRLAHDPGDGAALARVVNVPPRRLGRLSDLLRADPRGAVELPALAERLGAAAVAAAGDVASLVEELHAASRALAPAALLDLALERSGYRAWVAGQADAARRLEQLDALRELAGRAGDDLGAWLAELGLGEDAEPADAGQRVLLTTIHGAKGGEWAIVFVVGLEEGLLPHARALADASDAGCEGLDAELRVAYVAVTRPCRRLYLTCCRARRQDGEPRPRRASRFLRELPADLVRRAA